MLGIKVPKDKLSTDIFWTVGSFAVLAASGIVINLVVAGFRDAAALGAFNLAYAVYIIASQIAAAGIHYSVLRYAAFYEADPQERGGMLLTACALALCLGIASAVVVFFAAPSLGKVFDSSATGLAIHYAAFGLLLFPLNKILTSYINGMRHMRAFSILQAARYLLVMAWVAAIAASDHPFELSTLAFLIAESVTALAAIAYIAKSAIATHAHLNSVWVRRHLAFGSKSLFAGMFVEMNSRIDVLLLGVFMGDRAVGVYSFAAMLVDGAYHLLAMIRLNFNPLLVATVRDGNWEQGRKLLAMTKRYGFLATGVISLLIVTAFFVLSNYIVPSKGLQEGIFALVILLTGLTLISAFVPFDNLLLVSGHPAYQAFQQLTVVSTNVLMCVVFVPRLGIEGAALGTATAYLIGIAMLIILSKRLVGWNLLTNVTSERDESTFFSKK